MSLQKSSLGLSFVIALLLTLLTPAFVPWVKIFFFAPFMIMVIYQKPLIYALWMALLCGLVIDLLSSNPRLPLHGIAMIASAAILFPQRRHFFADTLSTLPIMTFLFSLTFTVMYFLLINMYRERLDFSFQGIATELLLMPALDALYAFSLFQAPSLMIGKRPMKGEDYFAN